MLNAKEQRRADFREVFQTIEADDAERLKVLLTRSKQHGEMVDQKMLENQKNRTPLDRAATLGAINCLRVMLATGAVHNTACGNAFRFAVLAGQTAAADLLLADLDARVADGRISEERRNFHLARGVGAAGLVTDRARATGHNLALRPGVRRAMQATANRQDGLELLDRCISPTGGYVAPIAGPRAAAGSR